jgi:outer membrane protein assembly factor BamB
MTFSLRVLAGLLSGVPLCCVLGGVASAQLAGSAWPKFQHDAQNTGRSDDFAGPVSLPAVVWEIDPEGLRRAAPTLGVDGTIFLGVGHKPLSAFDPLDGAELWSSTEGNASALDRSQPAVAADGTVYFGARDNRLWSIDSTSITGTDPEPRVAAINWQFKVQTDGDVSTPPTVGPDGRVYMASDALGAGKFYALEPDRTIAWVGDNGDGNERLGGAPINVSPALSPDGTVAYITTGGRRLLAISTATGVANWEATADVKGVASRAFNYSPVVGADGTIYFAARKVVVAYAPDGTEKWRFEPGLQFGSPPALAGDGGDAGTLEDAVYVIGYSRSSTLFALDPQTGVPMWSHDTVLPAKARNTPPIVDAEGRVYAGIGRFLFAFDSGGVVLWSKLFPRSFLSAPVIGGDGVLYAGNGGTLYRLVGPSS